MGEHTTIQPSVIEYYESFQELPWYAWLFVRLHTLIVQNVIQSYSPRTVLDVGCGTGFQSFLYAAFGARVVGIDIDPIAIRIAQEKAPQFSRENSALLSIRAPFPFVRTYNRWVRDVLDRTSPQAPPPPAFIVADARSLPFPNGTFDHINSCGSVLSLIPEHQQALSEMVRVLKPGGTLFLEAEGRWNGDLLWTLTDALRGNRWGYGMPWQRAQALVRRPFSAPVTVDYPDEDEWLRLTLFTRRGLRRDLQRLGMEVLRNWTIHSLTNMIPSLLLHRRDVPEGILWLFRVLSRAEERIPLALPGCSLVFVAQKGV